MADEIGASQGNTLSAQKQKDWDDLDVKEKIERMRAIIKSQEYTFERYERMFESLNLLSFHSHAPNGDIVVPLMNKNNLSQGFGKTRSSDINFF